MSRSTSRVLLVALVALLWPGTAPAEETAAVVAGSECRAGTHTWLDFVSPGRGWQIHHGDAMLRRLAHVGNLGFGWDGELFSVNVTDSLVEFGQFHAAGGNALVNTLSPLTNPSVVASIRPVRQLRFDLEADLLWAFDLKNGPSDFKYTSIFGGAFAVWEPLGRYVGYFPLIEVGLGARAGMAWTNADQAPAGLAWKGSRVLTGLRFRLVLPLRSSLGGHWSDAGFFVGGAYYVDPVAGYDATDLFKIADAEWTLGLRWFM